MNLKPRIYLAGPGVFRSDAKQYGLDLKRMAKSFGMEGLWPLDASINNIRETYGLPRIADGEVLAGVKNARLIYSANVAILETCDGVIADISPFRGPSLDPGTAFEIGYAVHAGKPVFAWSNDHRSYLDRCRYFIPATAFWYFENKDKDEMLIENFGLSDNLMISIPIKGPYRSAQEAMLAASDVLISERKEVAQV